MSWAEEDWTVGLSGRVLQKVKELRVHHERLSRENKQKQLQLDNVHTSLEKQTVKYEEVRGELQTTQRELQSVRDEAKTVVTSRERLAQELQTKQAQVCSFEGQLDSARTLINKLTQDVKRLEAEVEKLQNSSRSADTTLFSTPCWNTSSPWEHNGSRKEERTGHRDEGQSRVPNSRQRLQFPEVGTASLPRQQHKNTPHRHPSDQSDSFSTPLAVFPWERDDSRPASKRRSPPSPQTPSADVICQVQLDQGFCEKEKDCRRETDTMQSRLSALEEELCAKAGLLKSIQNEMVQSKKELATKELSAQRARDELSLAHTRIAQESERASGAEQRLKQLQEELKCQRQNAESSRLQHQQRCKELEKQHQRDLTELQKERQCLEKQHQQEVNKLNQELQQARTLHNALQAQADKEAVREAEGVAVSLEQSRKKERALEEEGRRLAEERADALRLLKELQEQKAAPAPVVQPVQFCPVGQSFSPQPSYSLHARPSPQLKRATTVALTEQKRGDDADKRRAEVTASYPSDREPGEGIDSEHISAVISPDSESLQRGAHRRKSNEEENRSKNVMLESDSAGTNKHSSVNAPSHASMDDDRSLMLSTGTTSSLKSVQAQSSEDLRRENATLRSELQDAREELQKRLDDLEAQRRAEAEARTRLKQLSRKHASQSVEKEEQDKEWRAQLESEKAETEKVRKAVAALETELMRVKEEIEKSEREGQEEEKNKVLENRESEMIELNIQLKKQLAEVKAQLALEREERKREEEEKNQITNADIDVRKELSMKVEHLKAELEELKRSREDDSLEEEKLSVANSPLTYLTLHDDELNSNTIPCDNKLLPSPEQHLLFCQSTNQHNMLVSQTAEDLIREERTVIDPDCSPLSDEGQISQTPSELEDTRQNYLVGSSLSDHIKTCCDVQKDEPIPSDLAKEVKRLQKENAKETERANQYQVKLEALQSQVTRQTQQLTLAFEKQSQHISGLLAELQEKESALFSQGEELQRYKQELDALEAQKEEEEKKRREETAAEEVEEGKQKEETQDERSAEISGLEPNQEKECAVTFLSTNPPAASDSNAQGDAGQPEIVTSDSERQTPTSDNEAPWSEEEHSGSVDSDNTQSNQDSACVVGENNQDGGRADMLVKLLALQQENQLLKQRLNDLTVSDANTPVLHSDGDEGDLERMKMKTTRSQEELEEVCQLQIKCLQKKVVELHMKLQAVSKDTQQQAEELTMWRLASQPAPTFDLSNTDNQSETRSNQQQTDEASCLGVQESPGNVTVTREDELLLSSSSNKLQGRMLFSRLQHSNLSEPKSLPPSKQTASPQEYNQDTAKIDKDSEKENQEIKLVWQSNSCQTQHKEKTDTDVIQMSSEKTDQHHVTKDSHKVLGSNQTKAAECHMGNPEAKPEASRATNEINTSNDSSNREVRTKMRNISSQTEECLYPRSAPTATVLHSAYTQTEEEEGEEEELVESPPVSPVVLPKGAGLEDKVLFSGSFPIPADPVRLAERIRRNRTQLSAAFDDTEYEPYGLPEVVMKDVMERTDHCDLTMNISDGRQQLYRDTPVTSNVKHFRSAQDRFLKALHGLMYTHVCR
ncbi:Centromere protein F [Nibea albiflora]|uniref:Centromere protein F n=1 Tax=Nibea albiflora TaxID=240163 RepID=A0ACB7EP37_NIBAL|nr:Centromere protein F [Nibea albiflora]